MIEIKTIIHWSVEDFDADIEEHINDGWSPMIHTIKVVEELFCFVCTLQRVVSKSKERKEESDEPIRKPQRP